MEKFFLRKDDEKRRANLEIQVGAFQDHRNAQSLIEKLSDFEAYIKENSLNEKYLYKVRIGPIENINIANSIKKNWKTWLFNCKLNNELIENENFTILY